MYVGIFGSLYGYLSGLSGSLGSMCVLSKICRAIGEAHTGFWVPAEFFGQPVGPFVRPAMVFGKRVWEACIALLEAYHSRWESCRAIWEDCRDLCKAFCKACQACGVELFGQPGELLDKPVEVVGRPLGFFGRALGLFGKPLSVFGMPILEAACSLFC